MSHDSNNSLPCLVWASKIPWRCNKLPVKNNQPYCFLYLISNTEILFWRALNLNEYYTRYHYESPHLSPKFLWLFREGSLVGRLSLSGCLSWFELSCTGGVGAHNPSQLLIRRIIFVWKRKGLSIFYTKEHSSFSFSWVAWIALCSATLMNPTFKVECFGKGGKI